MNLSKFTPILANCHQGQLNFGVQFGGEYLLKNIFSSITKHTPFIISEHHFNNPTGFNDLYNLCGKIYKPLIIGGDHSIGTSTVLSSVKKYGSDLTVIWIDAHADINTMESSISKNRHGTPLACATGLDKIWFNENIDVKLNFDKLIYVGIRDLDPFEEEVLIKYNIKNYTVSETIDFINSTKDLIHISFDVDGLDPKILDSTGTMALGGLDIQDVKNIINASLEKDNLVALDVVEFNPKIGDINISLNTVKDIFL